MNDPSNFGDPRVVTAAVSAVVATTALFFNAWTQRRANIQARAKMVTDALDTFSKDADMQQAFYEIEWGEFCYDPKTFDHSALEKRIDKLLRLFANVARLHVLGVLMRADLNYISYYLVRIVRNAEVQKYLRFVDELARSEGVSHPYGDLLSVAVQLGVALNAPSHSQSEELAKAQSTKAA
jgi:hypothetical protein